MVYPSISKQQRPYKLYKSQKEVQSLLNQQYEDVDTQLTLSNLKSKVSVSTATGLVVILSSRCPLLLFSFPHNAPPQNMPQRLQCQPFQIMLSGTFHSRFLSEEEDDQTLVELGLALSSMILVRNLCKVGSRECVVGSFKAGLPCLTVVHFYV